MSDQVIPNGTEFAFDYEPDVRWRVEAFLGERDDEEGPYTVYRCRVVTGEDEHFSRFYNDDRNPDGTVDLVGEAIKDALDAA